MAVSPEGSLSLIVQVCGEAPFPKASLEPSWVGETTRGYYDTENSDVTSGNNGGVLYVARLLFVVPAMRLSFMEGVMLMTHVFIRLSCLEAIVLSGCVVTARLGSWRL